MYASVCHIFKKVCQYLSRYIHSSESQDQIGKASEGEASSVGKEANCQLEYRNLSLMERNEILEIFNRIRIDDEDMLFDPHAFSYEGLEVILAAKSDYYAIVFLKSEVIGYCLLRGIDEGYVDFSVGIFIFSNYRKMGYGREIMSYLEAFALSRNVTTLRLSVKQNNVVAKNLYTKLGYRKITDKDDNFEIWTKYILSKTKRPE